jgi:CheY-like chemotaxis protein
MMEYTILCVDDEREVLESLLRDLEPFERAGFRIESASSVIEAREVVAGLEANQLALVLCDHLMPGITGVEFLIELAKNPSTRQARKVLVTGQAGLADTVKAVNQAGLDHYIAKPWTAAEMSKVVIDMLTGFVIAVDPAPQRFAQYLDFGRIMEAVREREF